MVVTSPSIVGLSESAPPAASGCAVRRVLHVVNGEHYSGAERVQDLLAARLPEFGFQAAFACVKPGRFPHLLKATKTPVYATEMKSRWDLRPARQLAELARHGEFDLLHAHTPRTALLTAIAARAARLPWVYHVHSPTARDSTHRWQNRLNALVERVSMSSASALIAVSQSLGDRLCRWKRFRDRVFVVPNGVPCQELRMSGVPGAGPWTLGTVALFRPRKGLETLLESLAILAIKGVPVRLRAVGDFETPEYRRQIMTLADALGVSKAIEWVGFARDVNRQLSLMNLFVLPSLFGEGLPMVVLEAMAVGVPVVATRVEGVPEAIRHGREGLLVEPGDPPGLAQAIARFAGGREDWAAMSASALDRHAAYFSDKAMAAGVAGVYRGVLPGSGETS